MRVIRITRVICRDRSQHRIRIRCRAGMMRSCRNRTRVANIIISVVDNRRIRTRRRARARMCVISRAHITCVARVHMRTRSIRSTRRVNRVRNNLITRTRMVHSTRILIRMCSRDIIIQHIRIRRRIYTDKTHVIIIIRFIY